MFKKAKNKILLLNMAMASSVVIAAFAVIFIISYLQVTEENRERLESNPVTRAAVLERFITRENATSGGSVQAYARPITPGTGLSFSIIADTNGNIKEINSIVDLPRQDYERAALEAVTFGEGKSIILGERRWQYAIHPITIVSIESDNTFYTLSGEFSSIRFLDVTDSYTMLRSLAFVLSGLSAVILGVFFFISRYFASKAVRPMEEAWEKQARFIADASHGLKTPLTIINANCGVLYANKEEIVETQTRWLDSIMRAADRMSGLIGNLLTLARMGDAEQEFVISDFNLSLTIDETVLEMETAALEKGLRIIKNIENDIFIRNDPEQIRQILYILLDNAVKYTNPGEDITISLKNEKRHILCAVRNSGEGIKDIPRLFERFYRSDPSRSFDNGGYGLGLPIAKAVAERIGAELTAVSKLGEYAEFILRLERHKNKSL